MKYITVIIIIKIKYPKILIYVVPCNALSDQWNCSIYSSGLLHILERCIRSYTSYNIVTSLEMFLHCLSQYIKINIIHTNLKWSAISKESDQRLQLKGMTKLILSLVFGSMFMLIRISKYILLSLYTIIEFMYKSLLRSN